MPGALLGSGAPGFLWMPVARTARLREDATVTNRIQRPRRVLTSIVLSTVLVGGLASCSGDASIEKFCDENAALEEGMEEADPTDAQAGMESLRGVLDKANDIDAPEEIKADWDTMLEGMERFVAVFDDVDMNDQAAVVAASEEAVAALGDGEFEKASQNVNDFSDKNCTEESASPSE